MIYFDVTKSSGARHRSGLTRVSARIREELGARAVAVVWRGGWRDAASDVLVHPGQTDWVLTPELFSEAERPGFWEFLNQRGCRSAAIFHDAIPLKFPQTTWPQSVARHPEYMKMLSRFERVFAVSGASRRELVEFWRWQGAEVRAEVDTLALGADFLRGAVDPSPREAGSPDTVPLLLSVGIIEPRKNQMLLADVAEALVREGVSFQLEIVGRVNPRFGIPIEGRLRRLAGRHPCIRLNTTADDALVARLWRRARASVFPTLSEGCGLPLIESLWMGVPCVCSDLPVLRENGGAGGCEFIATDDRVAWTAGLRRVLTDDNYADQLRQAAIARVVPTWRQAADQLCSRLT
jgi:glycosyltransferase involved in cell wall biosynthesis